MKRLRCCCPTVAYNPTPADQRKHLLETHGIVPTRDPQVGDTVYPKPEFADPWEYEVGRVRSAVRCYGCHRLFVKDELNASRQWCTSHFCLSCVGWEGGTPDGRRIARAKMTKASENFNLTGVHAP